MSWADKFRTLEHITRPPRHPRDLAAEAPYAEPTISTATFNELIGEICARFLDNDVARIHAWADELAEREAEEEYLDPDDFPIIRTGQRNIEDVPGQEPPLSSSELVGVRQLIEERFGDQTCSPIDVSPARETAPGRCVADPRSPSPAPRPGPPPA